MRMLKFNRYILRFAALLMAIMAVCGVAKAQNCCDSPEDKQPVKKILFIGDSMTGWLAERLNAYGAENGFEVATIVWDGSTIKKWGSESKLKSIIAKHNPDAVFVSLGMNELFEANPRTRLESSVDKIIDAVGNRHLVWVGPPSWPGHNKGEVLNSWLAEKLGPERFFRSFDLKLERQSKTNPHPSRTGITHWVDALTEWLKQNPSLHFKSLTRPDSGKMIRGKDYVYKKMKESL